MRLLVANRAEIAVRIMSTAAVAGIETVAVYPDDDAACAHVARADAAVRLPGAGPAAYLDVGAIVDAAAASGCDTLHPGYGFLAESGALARRCAAAGVRFAGPPPEVLDLFGDKTAARARAASLGVPLARASDGPVGPAEARAFLASLGSGAAVMVKAVAGGGGRGMRPVTDPAGLDDALRRSASEAAAAFGNPAVYVEELLTSARHIEVQVIGDGSAVAVLGDRDCSLQRRRQKLIEIAPAALGDRLRARAARGRPAAHRLDPLHRAGHGRVPGHWEQVRVPRGKSPDTGRAHGDRGGDRPRPGGADAAHHRRRHAGRPGPVRRWTGLAGRPPHGAAPSRRGSTPRRCSPTGPCSRPAGPSPCSSPRPGAGVRVDTHGYPGYTVSPRYDSLLAKVIVTGHDRRAAANRLRSALGEFGLDGVAGNLGLLRALAGRLDEPGPGHHLGRPAPRTCCPPRHASQPDPAPHGGRRRGRGARAAARHGRRGRGPGRRPGGAGRGAARAGGHEDGARRRRSRRWRDPAPGRAGRGDGCGRGAARHHRRARPRRARRARESRGRPRPDPPRPGGGDPAAPHRLGRLPQ